MSEPIKWKTGRYNSYTLDLGFISAVVSWKIMREEKDWVVRVDGTRIGSYDNRQEAMKVAESEILDRIKELKKEITEAETYLSQALTTK